MRVTEKKLAANRANARKSTGPRGKEGKARSARNSLKHGFAARDLIVTPGERTEADLLRRDLLAEFLPLDPAEEPVFAGLLHACWNLHRLRKFRLAIGGLAPLVGTGLLPFQFTQAQVDRAVAHHERYLRRHLARYRETLRILRDLQERRSRDRSPAAA